MTGTCAHGRGLCKDDATSAPTVNDDITLGYTPGSLWVDVTADKVYFCVDNTDAAAIWKEISFVEV